MDFELGSTHFDTRQRAQELADSMIRPNLRHREKNHEFPLDVLSALASAGLMGVNVNPEYGGLGAGVVSYSEAVQVVAAADPAVAVTMCVNNMVAEVLQQFGGPSHLEMIPKMTSGEWSSGSFCLSEPGSGSDAAAMQTRAEHRGDSFVLSGTKAWITSGAYAGVFLVWARVGDSKNTISAFVVDPKLPGITFGKPEEKMGQHASNTVALAFDEVVIPESALLGDVGDGFRVAMMALDGGRVGIASQAIGIADEALRLAEAAEIPCDDLFAEVEAARVLVWRAAWMKEAKMAFTVEASMAKLHASETACRVCESLVARSGIRGLDPDFGLEKLVRDARVTRIYEGTSEIQRIVISRDVLRSL
jgi:alkylation response protein AidB-like acyl-CoA dehydrogenase